MKPNVDLIDYLKFRAIEENARQYANALPLNDADKRSAQADYEHAKQQADRWYADHKESIDPMS